MEFVLVVPRQALFPELYPHGLVPFGSDAERGLGGTSLAHFEAALAREGHFVQRSYAERTPSLKQIIPYSLVECGNKLLLVRRTTKGGDARLHNKYSIGIGGHINPEDLDGSTATQDPVDAGTRRELSEELAIAGDFTVRRVGLINDDSNAVGAVHVGVVQVIHVQGTVEIREREQLEGRLVSIEELATLLAQGANFETWSKLLIDRIDELLPKPFAALA